MHDPKMAKYCGGFGVLVFLVGLFYVLSDLGYVSTRIGMWSLLVLLFGLGMMGCMLGCGKYCNPPAK